MTRHGPTKDTNPRLLLLLQHTPISYYGIIRNKHQHHPPFTTQQPDNRMAAAIRYSREERTNDDDSVTMNNFAQNASPFTFSHCGCDQCWTDGFSQTLTQSLNLIAFHSLPRHYLLNNNYVTISGTVTCLLYVVCLANKKNWIIIRLIPSTDTEAHPLQDYIIRILFLSTRRDT